MASKLIRERLELCLHHLDEIDDWDNELSAVNQRYQSHPDYAELLEKEQRDPMELNKIADELKGLIHRLYSFELKTKNEVDIKTWAMKEDKLWRDILKRKGIIKEKTNE